DIRVERSAPLDAAGNPVAGIVRYGNRAEITGPARLTGGAVKCLDIRAGAGVVLAGLVAEGETQVGDIFHLARGYEQFTDKLTALGARVREVGEA
ncbi:MAG: hypothetical protein ACKOWF_03920, partial [Chloroflexota bacterium]